MSRNTALTVHESFASNLAFGNEILWDEYTPEQLDVFKKKLNELFRSPSDKNDKASKAMEKLRENIYRQTVGQTKYTNKMLLANFILVSVTKGTTYMQARDATTFSVHLVIRTRKCMKENDSTGCCMVFIDESGNVYKNWQHFIETNCLPSGIALAPSGGVYTYSGATLNMDAWATPASGLGSKILTGADYAAGIGGIGAAGVTLAAICTVPISAPIMVGATVVALGAGAITAVRSSMQLWKRTDHEQSISVTDSEARGCWLGIASGALALSSAAVTKSLSRVVLAGQEVSLIHETVVNGMNISTMLVSGSGVANGVLDLILKYADEDKVSVLEVAQLSASLVIFTHSVYNFRLASTIVSQTQDSKFSAYKSELSNRQRKMFDKLAKETVRTKGNVKGKVDLIRLINEVPDKQYLNDLHKSNKQLNKNRVRFAAGQDGNVVLNEDISVKPSDLRSDIQLNQGKNILKAVSKPIPESHTSIPNQGMVNDLTTFASDGNTGVLLEYCKNVLNIGQHLILNSENFQDCVHLLINKLGNEITEYLMRKARDFIQMFGERIESLINAKIYMDKVLFDLFKIVQQHLQDVSIPKLEQVMKDLFVELRDFYEKMSSDNAEVQSVQCPVCNGFYKITPI